MEIEINKLSDAINFKKSFTINNVTKLTIKLFDDKKKYSASQFKMLDTVQKIITSHHNTPEIVINTLNEKLPKDVFVKICNFYKNIGSPENFKIAVKHHYIENDIFSYSQKFWDIKTIIKANIEIEKVCKFIKDSNFSPMEAFAYIHGYVQKVAKYNYSNKENHALYDNDQFFVGAYMKLPEVVCAGYCALMEVIIRTLNMPGLDCDMMTINIKNMIQNHTENHARCIVKVDDIKYGVNQSFFDDPTWDSSVDNRYPVFTHFAMKNNSHDHGKSPIIKYDSPKLINVKDDGRKYLINNLNERSVKVNNSEIKMNQLLIEKVIFNVIKKTRKNEDFDTLYGILSKITKASFINQKDTKFSGYFAKANPILTKEKAKEIFNQNNSQNDEISLKM